MLLIYSAVCPILFTSSFIFLRINIQLVIDDILNMISCEQNVFLAILAALFKYTFIIKKIEIKASQFSPL